MSLFQCINCGCVENTATCRYWLNMGKHICSECDPKVGKWHGEFCKRDAAGMMIGANGYLYDTEPSNTEIIGIVPKA